MVRNLFMTFLFCVTLTACSQKQRSESVKGLIIDPGIENKAVEHIQSSKELDVFNDKMQVYLNTGFVESYQDDKLVFRSNTQKAPFKSFYFWRDGTLTIDGAFGIFGGVGFGIDINKNGAKLYHLLSSDDFPSYAYKENDSLVFRLEVPCTDTKIVLSAIPDSTNNQIIYGYVEFKSANYFGISGIADGQGILPRQKFRSNMKLYFKSGKLNL